MHPNHLPNIDCKYWTALVLASILGANMGDFLSEVAGLGHLAGLPVLAVLLAIVFLIEKFDSFRHHAYFWLAIVIVRAAATNIGDIGHDHRVPQLLVLLILATPFVVTLFLWRRAEARTPGAWAVSKGASPASSRPYWWTMLLAGALGTAIGDYSSYGLQLGNLKAALILGAILAVLFVWGRGERLSSLLYYWIVVVCIRSAGTAAGDFLASRGFGLPVSTLVSALALVALLLLWRKRKAVCYPVSEMLPEQSD